MLIVYYLIVKIALTFLFFLKRNYDIVKKTEFITTRKKLYFQEIKWVYQM